MRRWVIFLQLMKQQGPTMIMLVTRLAVPQERELFCYGRQLKSWVTQFDKTVGRSPFSGTNNLFDWNHVQDRTFWVPGDWGAIANRQANPELGREAENVIYLGDGFSEDFDAFKGEAVFWGLGMGPLNVKNLMTLGAMLDGLTASGWGPLEIASQRTNFKPR
jgi:hypothetical protein